MQSLLPALAPRCAKLVGPGALERIDRLARDLPAIGTSGALELHLGAGDRADLLVFSDGQGGRRKLARALALGESILTDPALRPLLEEWTLAGAILSESTSLLWLEAATGTETVDLPGIESLIRLDRLPDFKLVLDARGKISAKAYLGFRARETLF